MVDFELFRGDLECAVPRSDPAKGGRPTGLPWPTADKNAAYSALASYRIYSAVSTNKVMPTS